MMRRCIRRYCAAAAAAAASATTNVAVSPSSSPEGLTQSSTALTTEKVTSSVPSDRSSSRGVKVLKDYRAAQALRIERAAELKKEVDFSGVPLRYQLIEALPGSSLSDVKIKYLMACRKHHPKVGGDPEMYLRLALAYQDVLKDYGLEYVGGRIRNLGNFQACSYQAANYLQARSEIEEYIPISTLDDHIKQLEEARAKVGEALEKRIAANNTQSFWLLEDIESVMDEGGTDTVILSLLLDGTIRVDSPLQLTGDPLNSGLIGEGKDQAGDSQRAMSEPAPEPVTEPVTDGNFTASSPRPEAEQRRASSSAADSSTTGTSGGGDEQPPTREGREDSTSTSAIAFRTEVTKADVLALTAKFRTETRPDIAGEAARAATNLFGSSNEVHQLRIEVIALFIAWCSVAFIIFQTLEEYGKVRSQIKSNPSLKNQIATDTMLPWWGNDDTYEQQVKRIFVDEWRRARASAQRQRTYQDGVARESLPLEEKEKLDLAIFSVTSERLRKMKDLADSTPGKQ